MNRSMIVVLPGMTEEHISRIRVAAERHGFDCSFFADPSENLSALEQAEVILGGDPFLSAHAPNLRWICSPSAGINQFIPDEAFANPAVTLTNSSGAYGVTIAEDAWNGRYRTGNNPPAPGICSEGDYRR